MQALKVWNKKDGKSNLGQCEWKDYTSQWMTSGNGSLSSEELISNLLDQGITFAIRIVPVRSTDYNHLRDGFTRAIQGRAKLARKSDLLSSNADEALNASLQDLKEAFPKASLSKGSALDLLSIPSGKRPRGTARCSQNAA